MQYAAMYGHVDILQYLFEKGGADLIHATNSYGGTPLHFSCYFGRLACIKYLARQGADLEAKTKVRHRHSSTTLGRTALFLCFPAF